MKKYFIILTIFALFLGCGRTGTDNHAGRSGDEVISKNDDFTIMKKSRFIQNRTTSLNSGHYSLLFWYAGNESLYKYGKLYENGSPKVIDDSEALAIIDPDEKSITNNILILLDFSGSIIAKQENRNALKNKVKSFIESVNDKKSAKFSLYYFTDKQTITPIISEPLSDTKKLIDEIDSLSDTYFDNIIGNNLIPTNLYGGVVEASKIMCNLVENCTEDMLSSSKFDQNNDIGYVVVFTDGRDTARWLERDEMLQKMKKNQGLIYQGVGIGNADERLLDDISTYEGIYNDGEGAEAINNVFDKLTDWANSFYEAQYCPADRKGTVDIRIDVLSDRNRKVLGSIKESNVELINSENFRCDLVR